MKPTFVGEQNPYGIDPRHALLFVPEDSAGGRLCHKVLGISPKDYLRYFERVNLCAGRWYMGKARIRAKELDDGRPLILLGSRVCSAFGIKFEPFTRHQAGASGKSDFIVLPHPSGLCRIWNEPGAYHKARQLVGEFCPDVKPLLNLQVDGETTN